MRSADTRYVTANIPTFLIRSLISALNEMGLPAVRLTAGLGVSLQDIADPACRISFRQGREIILRALDLAKGRALGLETGIREKVTSVGLVGYAMLTAATVGDAAKIGLDLQRDTGSMLEFDTYSTQEGIAVTAASRFHDPQIQAFLVEEAFASFLRIGKELAGEDFRPARVDLSYPPPAHAKEYQRIFDCDICFGQLENAFVYDRAWYSTPLKTSDPYSHKQLLEFLAFTRMRNREAGEIIEAVERVLRQRLSHRTQLGDVARELGMSERTLRRRLAASGVSFQPLIDGLRKGRALELLANPDMTVEQIAFATGFTDPHNFRRAFRRWTGETPSDIRHGMIADWPEKTP